MAYDANISLGSTTTNNGSTALTGIDLKTGSQRGPVMWARIEVASATVSTSPLVLTFTIEHSDSLGSGYVTHTSGADQTVTIATGATPTAPTGDPIVWIPIVTEKRYIRVNVSKTGGTTSDLTFNGLITNSHYQ